MVVLSFKNFFEYSNKKNHELNVVRFMESILGSDSKEFKKILSKEAFEDLRRKFGPNFLTHIRKMQKEFGDKDWRDTIKRLYFDNKDWRDTIKKLYSPKKVGIRTPYLTPSEKDSSMKSQWQYGHDDDTLMPKYVGPFSADKGKDSADEDEIENEIEDEIEDEDETPSSQSKEESPEDTRGFAGQIGGMNSVDRATIARMKKYFNDDFGITSDHIDIVDEIITTIKSVRKNNGLQQKIPLDELFVDTLYKMHVVGNGAFNKESDYYKRIISLRGTDGKISSDNMKEVKYIVKSSAESAAIDSIRDNKRATGKAVSGDQKKGEDEGELSIFDLEGKKRDYSKARKSDLVGAKDRLGPVEPNIDLYSLVSQYLRTKNDNDLKNARIHLRQEIQNARRNGKRLANEESWVEIINQLISMKFSLLVKKYIEKSPKQYKDFLNLESEFKKEHEEIYIGGPAAAPEKIGKILSKIDKGAILKPKEEHGYLRNKKQWESIINTLPMKDEEDKEKVKEILDKLSPQSEQDIEKSLKDISLLRPISYMSNKESKITKEFIDKVVNELEIEAEATTKKVPKTALLRAAEIASLVLDTNTKYNAEKIVQHFKKQGEGKYASREPVDITPLTANNYIKKIYDIVEETPFEIRSGFPPPNYAGREGQGRRTKKTDPVYPNAPFELSLKNYIKKRKDMAQSDSEYVKNEIKNTIDKIKKLEAEDEALVKANGKRKYVVSDGKNSTEVTISDAEGYLGDLSQYTLLEPLRSLKLRLFNLQRHPSVSIDDDDFFNSRHAAAIAPETSPEELKKIYPVREPQTRTNIPLGDIKQRNEPIKAPTDYSSIHPIYRQRPDQASLRKAAMNKYLSGDVDIDKYLSGDVGTPPPSSGRRKLFPQLTFPSKDDLENFKKNRNVPPKSDNFDIGDDAHVARTLRDLPIFPTSKTKSPPIPEQFTSQRLRGWISLSEHLSRIYR